MARLESEAKGGFYPTPPEEMKFILKRLAVASNSQVSIIDPCCGEGVALKQWKDDLVDKNAMVTSYGIELEKSRAASAKSCVDHLLSCGYEETRVSHESFSAMYLNPPFMQMDGERMENVFLRDLTSDYLQEGGVFIFNLPQYVLKECAKIIASRFTDIRVYRFSDANYSAYSQVIVYGIRRRKGLRSDKDRKYQLKMEKELINYSYLGKDVLPSLDLADWNEVQYTIPEQSKEVQIFQSLKVEPEDILASLQQSDFYKKVNMKLHDLHVTSGKKISPATHLKKTHIATAIASGALPEEMGDHLLVGVTKRVAEEKTVIDPRGGKEQNVTTLKPKSIVRVFSDRGIFNLK